MSSIDGMLKSRKPRERLQKHWLLKRLMRVVIITIPITLVLSWFGLAYLASYSCVHPQRIKLYGTPATWGLPYQDVSFPAADGLMLKGWFIPAKKSRGVIILCHGFPANRYDMLEFAAFLYKAGFSTLSFDFRGLGESAGEYSTIGYEEVRDAAGAITYLRKRVDTRKAPLGIMGRSLGAAVAIMTAAQHKEVLAVMADSPYASLDHVILQSTPIPDSLLNLAQRRTALWFLDRMIGVPTTEVSPLHSIAQISPRPVLLIHCLQDTNILPADSRLLMTAAREPKSLWLVDNATHGAAYNAGRRLYEKRITTFFTKAFRSS